MALKKGAWSPEEDRKLTAYITRYGIWNWSKMAEPAGLLRSGKSCRLRWMNYLSPKVKRGNFTYEEDETIIRMHRVLGNKWAVMAAALPGRTDNEIKNRWHTHLRKHQRRPGTEQSQVSCTMSDDHKLDLSKFDLLPKYDVTDSQISLLPYGFGLLPDASTSSSTAGDTSSSCTASVDASSFEESSSSIPNVGKNLYMGGLEDVFDESGGFEHSFSEFWDQEPMSPFGFYSSTSYDIWTDLSVPAADIDGVLIDPIFQF